MPESIQIKHRLAIDGVFGLLLLLFYMSFRMELAGLVPRINDLFFASYVFLLLGLFSFYLTRSMNAKLASALHVCVFPISSASFIFTKWVPFLANGGSISHYALYFAIASYNLLLIAYFILQYLRPRENPEPERREILRI